MKRQKWESSVQEYNDGIAQVYHIDINNEQGSYPVQTATLKHKLRFDDRTVGITRYWSAQQMNVKVDKLVRVPLRSNISTQDIVMIENRGETKTYSIKQIQSPKNISNCLDLTLEEISQEFQIEEGVSE